MDNKCLARAFPDQSAAGRKNTKADDERNYSGGGIIYLLLFAYLVDDPRDRTCWIVNKV